MRPHAAYIEFLAEANRPLIRAADVRHLSWPWGVTFSTWGVNWENSARPWSEHHVYAPGFYTGYGVKTLPGVREAIEQRNWPEAEEQIRIAAEMLDRFAEQIDRAAHLLVDGPPRQE